MFDALKENDQFDLLFTDELCKVSQFIQRFIAVMLII